MTDDIEIKDGFAIGPWREQLNLWTNLKTSIHDDKTAKKVGMRGGTIPGTMHLNLFPPLFLKLFGKDWFETGSLSLYYLYATMHKEKVRAVIGLPPENSKNALVETRVEMEDGKLAAKGTVSIGNPSETSYLRSLELKNSKAGETRILAGLKAGDELKSRVVTIKQSDLSLKSIVEPMDFYSGNSPWGGSILPPSYMYLIMTLSFTQLDGKKLQGVPFYGATELENINGPIKTDIPYKITGKLVSVGVSRKTEYFWEDTEIREKDSDKLIARMRHMNRFMKAGSSLYKDA